MSLLAVTVIGHDRPGIIADVTGVLAGLGGNLEDSTMTLLRGHFAMVLVVGGTPDPATVEEALASLAADGLLTVSVREVPPEPEPEPQPTGPAYVLSVHGGDRPGIVSEVTRALADIGANITDLSTRLAGDFYVLVAEVDIPPAVDVDALGRRLTEVGDRLGVEVGLRPLDEDLL